MIQEEEIKLMTFDGRILKLHEIEDQHLCNIVHYAEHIGMSGFYWAYKIEVDQEIQKRLNGKLLPYKPPVQSFNEIKKLKTKGMLEVVEGKILIKKDGEIIGEVVSPKNRKI